MLGVLAAPLLALLAPAGALAGEETPPGMLLVPGGRTHIGITQEELKRLLSVDPSSERYAGMLSAETPEHEVLLESFYAMPTEVTNEQYEAFVRSNGTKPPQTWGEDAIRAGSQQFQREQDQAKADATTQGLPLPEPAVFDPRAWWDANWPNATWSVPPGDERRPVVLVDYEMATRYARWAGFRLLTEEEFQRAVRGDSERKYPWGELWDNDKYAATELLKRKGGPFVVRSFPAGQTKQGLMDLAGNVWEWTSSRYTAFPGYERKVFEFGYGSKVRQVNALAAFDDTRRVVVGGSYQMRNLMCRATTRQDVAEKTSTDALGFRCARTPASGVDSARYVLEHELTEFWRPREEDQLVAYEPLGATALERWRTAPLRELPGQPLVPGYAIVAGHDEIVWCPVKQIHAIDPGTFKELCADEGVLQIGFLATTVGLVDPELAPGSYLVSYRQRGVPRFLSTLEPEKRAGKPAPEGAPLEELLKIDVSFDHVIFSDLRGTPLRALRASLEFVNAKEPRIELTDSEDKRVAHLAATIACRTAQKGFLLDLRLVGAPGSLSGAWVGDTRPR
ncbi:MAG: SUMF1/EgtB/PvdO family nonheme iron enzyme [Planctomycetes bacterium]|nr:SUMF1/EgtB/PvdO family nonheme iron enzyme [Planctomycetota bacterium]